MRTNIDGPIIYLLEFLWIHTTDLPPFSILYGKRDIGLGAQPASALLPRVAQGGAQVDTRIPHGLEGQVVVFDRPTCL